MKPKLTVKIGSLLLKNPVMVASGTFGYGDAFADFVNVNRLGAIVTKTITLEPREGNPSPRIVETVGGMLNAVGLQNDGVDDFVAKKMKMYKHLKTALIVSVAGFRKAEVVEAVRRLSRHEEISALELNISCPNVEYKDRAIAQDASLTYQLVREVRSVTSLPLIVKLSPNVTQVAEIAGAAEAAGADAVSLINTLLGLAIDGTTRRPVLGKVTGGLSGPAIKPVALRMVWEVYNKIKLPIIGMGGIMNFSDAVEFMIAGAAAVAVGTANFVNPRASVEVLEGLSSYLARNKIGSVRALTGSLKIK